MHDGNGIVYFMLIFCPIRSYATFGYSNTNLFLSFFPCLAVDDGNILYFQFNSSPSFLLFSWGAYCTAYQCKRNSHRAWPRYANTIASDKSVKFNFSHRHHTINSANLIIPSRSTPKHCSISSFRYFRPIVLKRARAHEDYHR